MSEELFSFLEEWRTSEEIKEEFGFTTSQWYNRSKRLRGFFITMIVGVHLDDTNNRTFIFKKKEGVK